MDGAEFKRRAKRYAKRNGLNYNLDKARGKGSHQVLTIGEHSTIVKQSEISKGLLRDMLNHLNIRKEEF